MMASMLITSRTPCSVGGFGVFQRNSSINFVTTFQVRSPFACGKDSSVCRAQTFRGHACTCGWTWMWHPWREALSGWMCCDCSCHCLVCRGWQSDGLQSAQKWDAQGTCWRSEVSWQLVNSSVPSCLSFLCSGLRETFNLFCLPSFSSV